MSRCVRSRCYRPREVRRPPLADAAAAARALPGAPLVCVPEGGESQYGTHEDTQTRSTTCTSNNTSDAALERPNIQHSLAVTAPASAYALHVIHEGTSHDACTRDGGGEHFAPPSTPDGGGGYSTDVQSDGGGGQATDRQCMTATTFAPAPGHGHEHELQGEGKDKNENKITDKTENN